MLRFSVVIPTFNGQHLLPDCVAGLRIQTVPADQFEIIIVDNGSTDGTEEWLRTQADVIVIRENSNLGFAEACNRGAAKARSEALVFLNNDTAAQADFLQALGRALTEAREPNTVCVAAKILDWGGKEVEFGGSGLNLFGTGFQTSSWQVGFQDLPAGTALPFACGGAMLVRKDAFEELGGFDSDFFAYYEDVDFGWRLCLSGHSVVFAPEAQVRHRRHATGRQLGGRRRHFLWYRNSLLTLLKNAADDRLPRLLPLAFASALDRIGRIHCEAANAKDAGDRERADELVESAVGAAEGLNWILRNFSVCLEKRSDVQRRRRVSDQQLVESFGLTLDLGPESDLRENSFAVQMLPLLDLSTTVSRPTAKASAIELAARLARDVEDTHRALDATTREANRLHADLDARNREVEQLRIDLQARSVELNERNLELRDKHRDLHAQNLELERLQKELNEVGARLDSILSSRSWRWTAVIRTLFRQG